MKSYRVVLTRRAKEDIIDIGDYITYTLLEPKTAYNFVKGLRISIATLVKFPARYGLIDDEVLSKQGIHCMPYKNYYVFYEVYDMNDTVVILRIGYNRRNWKEILIK